MNPNLTGNTHTLSQSYMTTCLAESILQMQVNSISSELEREASTLSRMRDDCIILVDKRKVQLLQDWWWRLLRREIGLLMQLMRKAMNYAANDCCSHHPYSTANRK